LHVAVPRLSAASLLLQHGADINAREGAGWTPLFFGVKENRAEVVDLLLKNKADVNVATAQGETPLFVAIEARTTEIVEMLLKAGADVNAWHSRGYSPIHSAASSENIPLLRAILQFKPNLEVRDSEGYTPLLRAVTNGRTDVVALLLSAGADPNGLYLREGTTPLHFAASKGLTEIAALLLEHKADANIVSASGQTAFDYASASSRRPLPALAVPVNQTPAYPPPQPLPAPGIPSRVIRQGAFGAPTPDTGDFRDLLVKYGADTNIARRGAIALQRNDYQARWFIKDYNPHNRFTLFELLANFYDPASRMDSYLPFPDLSRVRIHRLGTNRSGEELQLNVAALLREGDCSRDVWLQWGDVVIVPEEEHGLDRSWQGFEMEQVDTLTNCLRRQVFTKIKGQTNELTIGPYRTLNGRYRAENAQFWLSKVLFASKRLLSTSDLSRIKVYRTDPVTEEKLGMTFDLSKSPWPSDLWLRDGDMIDVPERPSATASAEPSQR
jgi:hypothetical protein